MSTHGRLLSRAAILPAAVILLAAAMAGVPAAAGDLAPAPSEAARGVQNGRIAFGVDPGSGEQIKTVAPDGSHLRTLVDYPRAAANSPAFSPRGDRLAYSRITDRGCHIILARRDGTHRRDLTGDRAGCENSPTFTPNGRRLLFIVQRCGSCTTWIAAMDLSGGHRHHILAAAPGTTPGDVDLSPNGLRFAFESTNDAKPFRRALKVARRDGTHVHTLVPSRVDVGVHFDWSSTGRWIVFTRWSENPPGHEANVALIRPDGSRQKRLTHVDTAGRAAGGATFSPDGRWIVYRYANLDKEHYWVSTMRVDGSHQSRILQLSLPPEENAWAPMVG
jgi:Tol biopolymer transport system component